MGNPLLEITGEINLTDPALVLAIRGWVDGGLVASSFGDHLTRGGAVVAVFNPDDVFDYRSTRPTIEFSDKRAPTISWPELVVKAVSIGDTDLLVLSGTEPNSRWQGIATELVRLAQRTGVTKVVAAGAVPAAVPHTRPTPVMTTSSDPLLQAQGLPVGGLEVPAALVNTLSNRLATELGIPEVGFWALIPSYVSGAYWPGVQALVARVMTYLDSDLEVSEIAILADEMRSRLTHAMADHPETLRFVERLEQATTGMLSDDGDIAGEIEEFLKSLGGEDNPFT